MLMLLFALSFYSEFLSPEEAAQVSLFWPVIALLTVKCYSVDRLIFARETYMEQSLTCSKH